MACRSIPLALIGLSEDGVANACRRKRVSAACKIWMGSDSCAPTAAPYKGKPTRRDQGGARERLMSSVFELQLHVVLPYPAAHSEVVIAVGHDLLLTYGSLIDLAFFLDQSSSKHCRV